jgi:hypothetical protein
MTTDAEPTEDDDFEPDAIYRLMLVCRYVLDFASKNGVDLSEEKIDTIVEKFVAYGDSADDPSQPTPAVGARPVVANILWFVEQLGVPINEQLHHRLHHSVMSELRAEKENEASPPAPRPPPSRFDA